MNKLATRVLAAFVSCYFVPSGLVFAADSPAVVGRANGHLAVQIANQSWRVIPAGGILPDVAECRTSADGPTQIFFGEGDALFLENERRGRRVRNSVFADERYGN